MGILPADPPAQQGFATIESSQSGRDSARLAELYRERYGDPDELDLERWRRVDARPALIPITPAEALAHLQQLVAECGGTLRVCVQVDPRQAHPFTIEGHR